MCELYIITQIDYLNYLAWNHHPNKSHPASKKKADYIRQPTLHLILKNRKKMLTYMSTSITLLLIITINYQLLSNTTSIIIITINYSSCERLLHPRVSHPFVYSNTSLSPAFYIYITLIYSYLTILMLYLSLCK